MKTAVFGGKFDPPHLSHQLTIFLLLEKFKMDEVWIIPSGGHPFGNVMSPFEKRFEMCKLMIKPWETENRVFVRDDEDKIKEKPIYTVNLLNYLKEHYPEREFHLAIGEDNYNLKDKWKDFDLIERDFSPIVIGRGTDFSNYFPLPAVSSSFIREKIVSGEDVSYLLPPDVMEFVKKECLYLKK